MTSALAKVPSNEIIVSQAIGKRRLLKVARKLERLPAGRFNYAAWVGRDWRGKSDLSCGTKACAGGWATTIPEIRAVGLRLAGPSDEHSDHRIVLVGKEGVIIDDSFEALAEVFGISLDESKLLFQPLRNDYVGEILVQSPDTYASAFEVAEHIRKFVALKWPQKEK